MSTDHDFFRAHSARLAQSHSQCSGRLTVSPAAAPFRIEDSRAPKMIECGPPGEREPPNLACKCLRRSRSPLPSPQAGFHPLISLRPGVQHCSACQGQGGRRGGGFVIVVVPRQAKGAAARALRD